MHELPSKKEWTLKEIFVLSAIGVVFAPLSMAWINVWAFATLVLGPIGLDVVFGFWFAVSIVCASIFRKPGVAFVAGMIGAVVQIPLGSPSGVWLIATGLVQGAGAEFAFFLTRYKNFRLPVLMFAGVTTAWFSFVYNWFRFGYQELGFGLLITMLVIRSLSGAFLGGVVGKVIADGLAATGVLASFPLGKEWRSRLRKRVHENATS